MRKPLLSLLTLLLLVCGGGSHCARRQSVEAPRLLPDGPSLAQLMEAVNANTARVSSLTTNNARLSVPGAPTLPTDIALERPQRFRLRAGTALTGPEVDLGSNDSEFWFWVRRNEPAAFYTCQHDRFATSAARQVIPVDPQWLIDALGMTTFDPAHQHSGPYPRREHRVEIHTRMPSPDGEQIKVTVVDVRSGWVMEQHLYTAQGQLQASSIASNHRYDPLTQVSLPGRVELQMPKAQLFLTLDLGTFQVNTIREYRQELWAKPVYPGFPEVDLCAF